MNISRIDELKPGFVLNNSELRILFGCSTQGGMRRATETNSLVIISNHVKSIYNDRWKDEVFYYTGMGMKGNQSLNFNQNKTLAESPGNGVNVYLFEVFIDKFYTYLGEVILANRPFKEKQPDVDGKIRDVFVFPLKLKTSSPLRIEKSIIDQLYFQKEKEAKRLSNTELRKRAENSHKQPGCRSVVSKQYDRDPYVSEHAKRLAEGICQLCNNPAPFKNSKGEPFLETHHIIWLSEGGSDTIENTVALCPNCHRKMHIVKAPKDITYLRKKTNSALIK